MSIRKIGEKLRNGEVLDKEEEKEFDIFRKNHTNIIVLFNKELEKIEFKGNSYITGRTKRIETIISKLRRPQHPKLNKIHDIAGSRMIFDSLGDLNDAVNKLNQIKIRDFYEISDKNKYNYIENPKADGYRGIHKVFKYSNPDNSKINNLKIELQLRTKLQHTWATAVEIYDMIKKTNLKTTEMNKLNTIPGNFFKCCSMIFEGIESNNDIQIRENINKVYTEKDFKAILDELYCLKSIKNIKLPEIKSKKENQYFILITNIEKQETTFFILPFDKNICENKDENDLLINSIYRKIEQKNEKSVVLLLNLKNVKNLQETYPNYFLDTKEFVEILEKYKKLYKGGD